MKPVVFFFLFHAELIQAAVDTRRKTCAHVNTSERRKKKDN